MTSKTDPTDRTDQDSPTDREDLTEKKVIGFYEMRTRTQHIGGSWKSVELGLALIQVLNNQEIIDAKLDKLLKDKK